MKRYAILSKNNKHRFTLIRIWDEKKPLLLVCMFNPSTADHLIDDPTILRLIAFGKLWGFGGLSVVNLHSLRTSNPSNIENGPRLQLIGAAAEENLRHIKVLLDYAAQKGLPFLVAWGNHGTFLERDKAFIELAKSTQVRLICLGKTQAGNPKHPMARGKHRVPDNFKPMEFS